MKDTEFKAKKQRHKFSKTEKTDAVIGRVHQERPKHTDKSDTMQKRNKKYQQFSNSAEQPSEQTELAENKHTDSVNAEQKAADPQRTEQQAAGSKFDIFKNTAKEFTPDTAPRSVTSEKHKSYKKTVQRKQI